MYMRPCESELSDRRWRGRAGAKRGSLRKEGGEKTRVPFAGAEYFDLLRKYPVVARCMAREKRYGCDECRGVRGV
jgi:hypothetical protein